MTVHQAWAYKKLLACVVPLQNISICGTPGEMNLKVEMPAMAATDYLYETRHVLEFVVQYARR